jgi:hypothetical protein
MRLLASLVCGLALAISPAPGFARAAATPESAAAPAPRDLSDLIRELRKAEQPEIRINVLTKIAAVSESPEEPNAVVNALARGLKDDSFLVAAKAAELLGTRYKNDAALEHLVDACGDLEKVRKKALDGLEEMKNPLPKFGDKTFVEDLNKLSALLDKKMAMLEELHVYETILLMGILMRRDDRCVEALADLMKFHLYNDTSWPIVEGLFNIGTSTAIEEVIELFPMAEKALDVRAKERKKLARQRPERIPKMWKGTKSAWKAREQGRIGATVTRFDAVTERLENWRFELSSRVQKLARGASLELPPSTPDADAWDDWWKKRRGALPESLRQ